MGEITVNFADVQSRSAVPAGDYNGVIADCVLKQKPGKEHPYLNWDVVIADGEHEGRHSFLVTSFQPDSLWKMMQTFQNLGFDAEEVNIKFDDATGQVTDPEVVGLACMIKTYNEPFQNRQTNKISDILGPNGEDVSQQTEEPAAAAATPATRPATRTAPATAAVKNGPATAAKRSPFPASKPGARSFKG